MNDLKKAIKTAALLLALICTAVFSYAGYCSIRYPDKVYASQDSRLRFGKCTVDASAHPITASADSTASYRSVLKIFGVIPVKDVSVSIAPSRSVIVCGSPFGVMLYSEGIMVVGSGGFVSENATVDPAAEVGIKKGDIIIGINGIRMTCIEDVTKAVGASGGKPISVEYKRREQIETVTVTPKMGSEDGKYHIGLWIRDSSAGIGTVTFYDPETQTGAGFGHPICDPDTGKTVEISTGTAVNAYLYSVRRGAAGNPGELRGTLKINSKIGAVLSNGNAGVLFACEYPMQGELMPVAHIGEIESGAASVYTTVDGDGAQYYDVRIESIDPSSDNKNFTVKITDKRLIEKTGGIVQGMSGSPLVQNGKLIGAITHVLVDDPTTGYAIFAENMLETAQGVANENKLKEAS